MRRALCLLLTLVLAAPAWAGRPLTTRAPEFPEGAAWLNAKPFTLKRLRGRRVVLLAFINLSSTHSLRSLAMLKKLDKAYSLAGLMVIGVHTPSYAYQRNPQNVQAELARRGVEFPVVLDNDRKIWNAYANEGWPGFYVINHRGRVIWDVVGEGRYEELESELRSAIDRMIGYSTPDFAPVLKDPPSRDCGKITPELDVGARRSPVIDLDKLEEGLGAVITEARHGEVVRKGEWLVEPDGLRLNQPNRDQSAFVRVIYIGTQAFATLSPGPTGKAKFFIRQDDLWLHGGNAAEDVLFDDDGRSYVQVDKPRSYALIVNPYGNVHELSVAPTQTGAVVMGFGFSDQCLKLEP